MNWVESTVGDFCPFVYGKAIKKEDQLDKGFPVYGSNGIYAYSEKPLAGPYTVIIGRKGSVGKLHLSKQPCWVSDTAFYVNFECLTEAFFTYYLLSTLNLENMNTDAAVPGLNRNNAHRLEIKVPEQTEDRAIVIRALKNLDDKIQLNRQTNQTLEHMAQAIFKSWFVDFEPTRAKAQARAYITKGIMPSDNVFTNTLNTGDEPQADGAQKPLPKNFSQADADQMVERAAMAAISGKRLSELENLSVETLEQLKTTAALFPETLVDSELGEVPEGWEAKPLGNYLEIKRGGSPRPIKEFIVEKGLPWTKIADATSEPSPFIFETKECIKEEGLKKTVLLKKGALILSNSATPGLPKFLELDACIHDGWLHFPEKQLFSDVYLYQLFLKIRKELVAQGNGSVFTNLKTDILRNQVVVAPLKKVIERFDDTVALIFSKLKENCNEINTLAEIRDVLLPKLLSGDLSLECVA